MVTTFESVDKIPLCDLWEHLNMLSIFCFSVTLGTRGFILLYVLGCFSVGQQIFGQSYKQPNGRYKDLTETGNCMKTPLALRVFFIVLQSEI